MRRYGPTRGPGSSMAAVMRVGRVIGAALSDDRVRQRAVAIVGTPERLAAQGQWVDASCLM